LTVERGKRKRKASGELWLEAVRPWELEVGSLEMDHVTCWVLNWKEGQKLGPLAVTGHRLTSLTGCCGGFR
jgi:hypothetical protein